MNYTDDIEELLQDMELNNIKYKYISPDNFKQIKERVRVNFMRSPSEDELEQHNRFQQFRKDDGTTLPISTVFFFDYEYLKWDEVSGTKNRKTWDNIGKFLRSDPCYLFFDYYETQIIEIENGSNLSKYNEMLYDIDFYVCDSSASYLIAYNSEPAAFYFSGTAKDWFDKLN